MGAAMKTAAMQTGAFAKASPHKEIYLHPGQTYISAEPVQISMILGSCAGACMFQAFRAENGGEDHIGLRNIHIALETFSRLGIVIVARDTGGENGRKISMQSDNGSVAISVIRNS